jgi:hypothetical protein
VNKIIRGDTHVIRIEITNTVNELPTDLAGKTVTVTCRKKDDSGPVLYQHFITVNALGAVTASSGMALDSVSTTGVIIETITSTESAAFKTGKYKSDLEVKVTGAPSVVATPLIGVDEIVVGDYTRP